LAHLGEREARLHKLTSLPKREKGKVFPVEGLGLGGGIEKGDRKCASEGKDGAWWRETRLCRLG